MGNIPSVHLRRPVLQRLDSVPLRHPGPLRPGPAGAMGGGNACWKLLEASRAMKQRARQMSHETTINLLSLSRHAETAGTGRFFPGFVTTPPNLRPL